MIRVSLRKKRGLVILGVMTADQRRLLKKGILAGILAVFLVLLLAAGKNAGLVERFYSEGIYRLIRRLFPAVLNAVPFSFGDLVYLFLVGWFLWIAGRLIVRLTRGRFADAGGRLLHLVITTEVLVIAFYLMWGLNFFRPPAAVRLELTDGLFR